MSLMEPPARLRSHEGGMAASFVHLTDAEAVALLRQHYGIAGTVLRFATEKDDTFRVDCASGRQFVLKVGNPSETSLEIAFQVELLEHIARVDPSLPVPRVQPDRQGRLLFETDAFDGAPRCVRLLSYLAGTPLARTHAQVHERERIGELLAQLRHATAGFSHPGDHRVVAWDVKQLSGLRHLLDFVPDARQRDQLAQALQRFAAIEHLLAACRTQVLHNDFNTSNIVVSHAAPGFVTGIIDFGDAVRTAIAADVSTALMNQLPREMPASLSADIFGAPRDVLRGYLRYADLTRDELELIPHLAMGRTVTRALLSTWRAQLFPENRDYILRHTAPGWAHLDWFLARSHDDISELLLPRFGRS